MQEATTLALKHLKVLLLKYHSDISSSCKLAKFCDFIYIFVSLQVLFKTIKIEV